MRRGGRRNRRQKPGYVKSQLRDRVSIHARPKIVEKRKRIGDWELDLVRCARGTEFFYHEMLSEALPVKVYFADPYNSGQRGTNENTNGLLRQYFPKTMNYSYISYQAVAKAQDALNHRPRLRLGFQTPASKFK